MFTLRDDYYVIAFSNALQCYLPNNYTTATSIILMRKKQINNK